MQFFWVGRENAIIIQKILVVNVQNLIVRATAHPCSRPLNAKPIRDAGNRLPVIKRRIPEELNSRTHHSENVVTRICETELRVLLLLLFLLAYNII
jgi:hypothetical protein